MVESVAATPMVESVGSTLDVESEGATLDGRVGGSNTRMVESVGAGFDGGVSGAEVDGRVRGSNIRWWSRWEIVQQVMTIGGFSSFLQEKPGPCSLLRPMRLDITNNTPSPSLSKISIVGVV